MFFPISSKSLSSAELLSVSVDNTSVDSNTLSSGGHENKNIKTFIGRFLSDKYNTTNSAPLVLQVKDPLALLLVALLVFGDGETRTSGELAHWTFA